MNKIFVKRYSEIPESYIGIVEYPDGSKYWYKNGEYHRDLGPCTQCKDCLKDNSELCSKPGPAIEYSGGTKKWFINGKLHRVAGPAVIYSDDLKYYYIHGTKTDKIGQEIYHALTILRNKQ